MAAALGVVAQKTKGKSMSFVSCIKSVVEMGKCQGCGETVEDEGGYHAVVVGDTDTPEQVQCGPVVVETK